MKALLKIILLTITAVAITIWLCGIESIVENGYFMPYTLVMAILIFACQKFIFNEEKRSIKNR